MSRIQKFRVMPNLPEVLKPLIKIANNLWWAWNFEAIELFRRLDVEMWREVNRNPIALLGSISQRAIEEAAESESFIAHMKRVEEEMDWHLSKKTWYDEHKKDHEDMQVAYFSAEFGIHECLPIYSGGLGVLAGDHLKSASELGLPLVGVGLMYKMGYFHQYLNIDGWQQERFPQTDFNNLPMTPVMKDNSPLILSLEYPKRNLYFQIWEAHVGNVRLYLMDADIDKNSPDDRTITYQLYGGDIEMRIKQEILLGIGGVRALKALGKNISVFHMNEGHSAFLALERIRTSILELKLSFNEALKLVRSSNVFTTHTPVPAGNDRFAPELVDEYLSHYYTQMGLKKDDFLALGRENIMDKEETFCMTVLALKTASHCNGVSKLHGEVSRGMWKNLWPSIPQHEVPITHITNGIQILSWTSEEMMRVLNRYLGMRWIDNPVDKDVWKNVDNIPNTELWRCRERLREHLVAFARKRLKEQLTARGVPKAQIDTADAVLDSDALTIGFARRFATYKRATLLLSNMQKFENILLNKERPVQIIFAGKAHPHDQMGKELIKQIVGLGRDERFRNKIVFIEDYDINVARYLVQGVDVWLNTPVRPKEASGTSGMKTVPNGVLNISVLDGWWVEGYNGNNGWAIGHGEEYDNPDYQNYVESESLYNILEQEVIPMFYDRGKDGMPKEWIARIKESMKTLCPMFNTNRMVRQYSENFYFKSHKNYKLFSDDNFKHIKYMTQWKSIVTDKWRTIQIRDMYIDEKESVVVGKKLNVNSVIHIGSLTPDDIQVELYFGKLNSSGEIENGGVVPMSQVKKLDDENYLYSGSMLCLKSGEFGYTVRVIPYHPNMLSKFIPGLVTWA